MDRIKGYQLFQYIKHQQILKTMDGQKNWAWLMLKNQTLSVWNLAKWKLINVLWYFLHSFEALYCWRTSTTYACEHWYEYDQKHMGFARMHERVHHYIHYRSKDLLWTEKFGMTYAEKWNIEGLKSHETEINEHFVIFSTLF